jgi:hypothetical protein
LFFFGVQSFAEAQKVNRSYHHFGTITESSERYTDFVIKNTSGKKIFILRIDCDKDVTYLLGTKTLMPDSSTTLRVQYNPRETGRFSRDIGIYVSSQNDPITVGISGEVRQVPRSSDLACPDFNRITDASRIPEFELQILVVDKLTGEPIENANVKLIQNGLPRYQYRTPKSGELRKKVEIGYYYFIGSAESYKGSEFDYYINVRNSKVIIELEPYISRKVDDWPNDSLFYRDRPEPVLDPGKPPLVPILTTDDQLLSPKDSMSFILPEDGDIKKKINHLVFLVDVSGSMMDQGRMDLLKASMIELCQTLKPEDRVTLITYSGSVRKVLENVPGDQKEMIIERIQNMEGFGYTAGAEALKMAYQAASKNFVAGGNNMVIMATDGAFNLYTTDVMPLVKRHRKKGIVTSVLAIKSTDRDAKTMETIAKEGGGRYVSITNMDEALQNLIQEVNTAAIQE